MNSQEIRDQMLSGVIDYNTPIIGRPDDVIYAIGRDDRFNIWQIRSYRLMMHNIRRHQYEITESCMEESGNRRELLMWEFVKSLVIKDYMDYNLTKFIINYRNSDNILFPNKIDEYTKVGDIYDPLSKELIYKIDGHQKIKVCDDLEHLMTLLNHIPDINI